MRQIHFILHQNTHTDTQNVSTHTDPLVLFIILSCNSMARVRNINNLNYRFLLFYTHSPLHPCCCASVNTLIRIDKWMLTDTGWLLPVHRHGKASSRQTKSIQCVNQQIRNGAQNGTRAPVNWTSVGAGILLYRLALGSTLHFISAVIVLPLRNYDSHALFDGWMGVDDGGRRASIVPMHQAPTECINNAIASTQPLGECQHAQRHQTDTSRACSVNKLILMEAEPRENCINLQST